MKSIQIKSEVTKKLSLLLIFLLMSLSAQADSAAVQWKGALKRVHHGDSSATINLSQFKNVPHFYAIGPVAGLDGEITVLESQFNVAQVRAGQIQLKQEPSVSASFLVWAEVPAWQTPVNSTHKIRGAKQLAIWIEKMAQAQGIKLETPFPFLIRAELAKAQYHVLAPPPEIKASEHQEHHQRSAAVKGHLKHAKKINAQNFQAQILGFYSRHHGGVFTHMGSKLHLHLHNQQGHSGHLDDFVLSPNSQLLLPIFK